MGDQVWKVLGTGGALVAGMGAKKVLSTAWKIGLGEDPPTNPESPDVTWKQAIAWAVLSGMLTGLAKLVWHRQSAQYFKRSTGHLPGEVAEAGN